MLLIIDNYPRFKGLKSLKRIKKISSKFQNVKIAKYYELKNHNLGSYDGIILTGSFCIINKNIPITYSQIIKLILSTNIPIIGICFGLQLISYAYGSTIAKMDKRRKGYFQIKLIKSDDPIFNGINKYQITVKENHLNKVNNLIEDFELLASSEQCKIEAIKHKNKLIHGFQFHPESYSIDYPDGKLILENFLRIIS
ncbi:MAG: gamma-glutamyl-gamma-aminobutyrate hydrolase family protein [Candidatus Bathyarchaeia archaeon]